MADYIGVARRFVGRGSRQRIRTAGAVMILACAISSAPRLAFAQGCHGVPAPDLVGVRTATGVPSAGIDVALSRVTRGFLLTEAGMRHTLHRDRDGGRVGEVFHGLVGLGMLGRRFSLCPAARF
jgi:hypothetical protein